MGSFPTVTAGSVVLFSSRNPVKWGDGYQGITGHYPGINLVMPEKKRRGRELTGAQKRSNKRISARRIKAGHAIGRMRQWGVAVGPYDGTMEQFGGGPVAVTVPANLSLLWNAKRKHPRTGY